MRSFPARSWPFLYKKEKLIKSTKPSTIMYCLKRTQPCADLISMTSVDAFDHFSTSSSTEGTRKRSASAIDCAWDHYKSELSYDEVELFHEYQGWRNKKRSMRHDSSPITRASRLKSPRHSGISLIMEDRSGRPPRCIRIPTTIFCNPEELSDAVHQTSIEKLPASPAVGQTTNDLAVM